MVVHSWDGYFGHIQGQVFQGSPQLWALPMSFVRSIKASAEEPKGKGVAGHISYHTAHLGNIWAEHKYPFSSLLQCPGDPRDQSKTHWLEKDRQKRSSSRFAGTDINGFLQPTEDGQVLH